MGVQVSLIQSQDLWLFSALEVTGLNSQLNWQEHKPPLGSGAEMWLSNAWEFLDKKIIWSYLIIFDRHKMTGTNWDLHGVYQSFINPRGGHEHLSIFLREATE